MRRKGALLFLLALGVGCAAEDESEQTDTVPAGEELDVAFRDVEDLPPMPEYPAAESGRLAVLSVGWQPVDGSFNARAGLCADVGVLEIYGGEVGTGLAIVVRFEKDRAVGVFPVVTVDSLLPDPPAARIGVQLFREPEAFGFQAFSGELEITEMDRYVSGRFAGTTREVRLNGLSHYVGTFDAIPVDTLSTEYCQGLGALLASEPDSGETIDSVEGLD